jgi:hypothetical protein
MSYTYIGCYNDGGPARNNTNMRALPNYQGRFNSVEECAAAVKQKNPTDILFGLQDYKQQLGAQCWSGSDKGRATGWGKGYCSASLGNAWTNQVYTISSQITVTPTPTSSSLISAQVQTTAPPAATTPTQGATPTIMQLLTPSPTKDPQISILQDRISALDASFSQIQAQNTNLAAEVLARDASFNNAYAAWNKSNLALQSQLATANLENTQLQTGQAQQAIDMSNMAVNLSSSINSISSGLNTVADNFNQSPTPTVLAKTTLFGSLTPMPTVFIPIEGFDTVDAVNNNISKMNSILNNEHTALDKRRTKLSDELHTEERIIEFNESRRKQMEAWNNILFAWVIGTFVIAITFTGAYYYTVLPQSLAIFVISMTIAVILIFTGLRTYDISTRWNMDFTKSNLNPPNTSQSNSQALGIGSGVVNAAAKGQSTCTDAGCCSLGTQWDASQGLCVTLAP